jgi:hypothetical protein
MAKSKELAKMVPESVSVSIDGGTPVLVATTAKENRFLNYFVAAQIRDMIQRSIKANRDADNIATAKELRDLAEAGRALATFSAELYQDDQPIPGMKPADKASDDIIDFDDLKPANDDSTSKGSEPPSG